MYLEENMTDWSGPFFIKNEKGEYKLAPMCKECGFGDKDGCCLKPCTYLWSMAEAEKKNND